MLLQKFNLEIRDIMNVVADYLSKLIFEIDELPTRIFYPRSSYFHFIQLTGY